MPEQDYSSRAVSKIIRDAGGNWHAKVTEEKIDCNLISNERNERNENTTLPSVGADATFAPPPELDGFESSQLNCSQINLF